MNEISIEKLDNKGRGICYINSKITFVSNALPGEIVDIEFTKETKKYNEAKVIKYHQYSKSRVDSPCPYFNDCGGCDLLNLSYKNTLKFKKDKLTAIMSKYANINKDIEIEPSDNILSYRNKITLKVENGEYGYYKNLTHSLIKIDNCLLAERALQNFIKDIKYLGVKNGEVVLRSNYNNELLIWIKSKEEIDIDIKYLKSNHKIVGIILNDDVINGDSTFIEIINHQLFNVSYDSFFQINRSICSKIFNHLNEYIKNEEVILDLYCGVGTLGITSSKNAKRVYGIEIVKNAILNAITNSKINKCHNAFYMLGDVSNCLPKIKDKVDTIIVDPPRAGLDDKTKKTIIDFKPSKIIYVSCDPMTLARDLKELGMYYNIEELKGFDMFPFTEHIETFCYMTKK